jgi:YHS domain-containing protein
MKNIGVRKQICLILIFVSAPFWALAANNLINTGKGGPAIHGYDPVAYFNAGKPVQGQADLSYAWSGATWLFSSAANRQAFIDDPQRYAPQFGGFCAYAVSFAQFADVDPEAWTIRDGKLYLNYSKHIRDTWRPRADEFIGDAEQVWPDMKPGEPDEE